MFQTRKDVIFVVLAGFFITNAIVAELIGGKLITLGPFVLSIGILPWPVVFLLTDLVNEYFGKKGVQKLTFLTTFLIIYTFVILFIGMGLKAPSFSPVNDAQFTAVFGQSMWIIIGSVIAFIVSQLVDVLVFSYFKKRTGHKMIWLRATGSTAFSQLIDTFIVHGIAFWLPGKMTTSEFLEVASIGYTAKLGIAIALTPLIYLGHAIINAYLRGEKQT